MELMSSIINAARINLQFMISYIIKWNVNMYLNSYFYWTHLKGKYCQCIQNNVRLEHDVHLPFGHYYSATLKFLSEKALEAWSHNDKLSKIYIILIRPALKIATCLVGPSSLIPVQCCTTR